MTRQLILVHGRAQEHRSADDVKSEWVDALKAGLADIGLSLPIPETDIHLPYYGDTLFDLVAGRPADEVAEIIVRGDGEGEQEQEFIRSMLLEIQHAKGITDEQVQQLSDEVITERGITNWKWVRAVAKALDTYFPGASGTTVALATRDVYLYLRTIGFQNVIDSGVRSAFQPNQEAVVVAHSLGTVVAYSLLRREGSALGWKVPLFVTLGSPLAVTVIKDTLAPIKHPSCVKSWFNAMDPRDIVALYPLDAGHFRIDPAIENKIDINNPTPNRHGITGYQPDPVVCKRIYDALTQ